MKIYVAAKFEQKDLTRKWYARLRAAGVIITHDWTGEDESKMGTDVDAYFAKCAQADVQGVIDADVLLLLPHARGQGMFVELGVALALNKPIIVLFDRLAPRSSGADYFKPGVFFHLPLVQFASDEVEVMGLLTKFALQRPSIAKEAKLAPQPCNTAYAKPHP